MTKINLTTKIHGGVTDEDEIRFIAADWAEAMVDSAEEEGKLDQLAAECLRQYPSTVAWAVGYCKDYLSSSDITDIIRYTIMQETAEANGVRD